MLKRMVLVAFIFLIILIAMTGFVIAGSYCATLYPGKHGVEIGGECFNCGDSDGICPIDFGVSPADCLNDPNCEYEKEGWWSESATGTPAILSSESSPFVVDLIAGKTLYLVLTNTGLPQGETVNFVLKEEDGWIDDNLGSVTGTVDAYGTAIASFTIDNINDINADSDEPISEVYFIAEEVTRTIFINTTYEEEGVASACGDYDEEDACDADSDGAGDNALPPGYSDPIGSECNYFYEGNCTWNSNTGNCTTLNWLVADSSNLANCAAAPDLICAYGEDGRIGSCDAGDDFFKVNYVSSQTDCINWTSGVIPCPAKLRVPFFGFYGFVASVFIIIFMYIIFYKRKQDL